MFKVTSKHSKIIIFNAYFVRGNICAIRMHEKIELIAQIAIYAIPSEPVSSGNSAVAQNIEPTNNRCFVFCSKQTKQHPAIKI